MSGEAAVYLEDIAGKLDEVSEDWRMFMHRKTGKFASFQNEHLDTAEEMESDDDLGRFSEWERDEIRNAIVFLSEWGDCVELPSQYDIHEYRIMEAFTEATLDPRKRELLLVAISGTYFLCNTPEHRSIIWLSKWPVNIFGATEAKLYNQATDK